MGSRLTTRGGARPKRMAARPGDWTPAMSEQFAETLADSCNVTLAAKAIGRSVSSVYRQRARDASFRGAWEQALAIGFSRLEMMLLERALHGVEKTVKLKDGSESIMRDYDNRMALALLRHHRDAVASSETPVADQEIAEARDRIMARIERIRARKGVRVETKGMAARDALLGRVARLTIVRGT